MGQAVDAGRPQRADRPALTEAIAMNERLQGCLVGAVMAVRPQRVRLIQQPITEDHVMHGARRDEDKARDTCLERCLEQFQRAGEVDAEEGVGIAVALSAAIPRAEPLYSGMDDSVRAGDELVDGSGIAQLAGQPFDCTGNIVESAPVAALAIPAAETVPGASEMTHDVAPKKSCRSGQPDFHEKPPLSDGYLGTNSFLCGWWFASCVLPWFLGPLPR